MDLRRWGIAASLLTSSGSCLILQRDGCGIECFLRCPLKRAIIEDTWLIAIATVSVERHRPPLLITEVAQTTEVNRGIAQPLEIFLTRFSKPGWIEIGRHGGLGVGVDIAQLPTEMHFQARVLARIVLACMRQDTIAGPVADCHGYFYPT